MYRRAIVRTPGKSLVKGISTVAMGLPDYHLALEQHAQYVSILEECGLKVTILPPNEAYPDSCFVEDVALLTAKCAIITRPGVLSRRGEVKGMLTILAEYFTDIEEIEEPGTLEAGDIMMVGDHFYIGLSERTNEAGASQCISILNKYGYAGSIVSLEKVLHLKTGLAYLENNNLLACGEFLSKEEFQQFNIIEIDESESYAANCVWVNGTVLVPAGFPKASKSIQNAGYKIIELQMSEFQKLDGGLSCLSLRF